MRNILVVAKTGEYRWMDADDEFVHPENGKYSNYLPKDLGLNLLDEVDEDDHGSECRVEHPYARAACCRPFQS